jgi:hypothetical protein
LSPLQLERINRPLQLLHTVRRGLLLSLGECTRHHGRHERLALPPLGVVLPCLRLPETMR